MRRLVLLFTLLLLLPQTSAAQTPAVNVTVASFNVNGGYTTEGGTWKQRLPYVVKTMLAGKASIYLIQEAHEGAGEHQQVLAEVRRQSSASWALGVGKRGNHFIYRDRLYEKTSILNVSLPYSKGYSELRLKHRATGLRFTVWNTHLTATMLPDTPSEVAHERRLAQAKVIASQYLYKRTRSVGGGDINDGNMDMGVRPIFAEVGHHDVRTLTTNVTNAQWDSHELHYQPNRMRGKWIDLLAAGADTGVNSAGLVDSVNASDHNLIWASVTIPKGA